MRTRARVLRGWLALVLAVWMLPLHAADYLLERWHGPADAEPAAIRAAANAAQFIRDPEDDRRLTPSREGMRWWRVRPAARWNEASPPVLALYAPYNNRVTVLAPPDYAPRRFHVRDTAPRPGDTRHAVRIDLAADWNGDAPVYIGLEGGRRMPIELVLQSRDQFELGELRYLRRLTALLTTVAVMSLVCGMFSIVLRDRNFLLLFLALGGQFAFAAQVTGEAFDWPGGRWLVAWGVQGLWFSRGIQVLALILFVRSLIQVHAFAPRLDRALLAVAAGVAVLLVAVLLPFRLAVAIVPAFGTPLLLLASLLLVAAALLGLHHRRRGAAFFLPAFLPLLLFDAIRESAFLGFGTWFPGNELAMPAASAWAAMLLAFGMADRLLSMRRERDAARDAAERDPLTGMFNRAGLLGRAEQIVRRARADGAPYAVAFIDLDHFKRINDRHGHAFGDACLRAVARETESELRRRDLLGRMGGEEFVLVLPGATLDDALRVAERVRVGVEHECARVDGTAIGLTVSIGVAEGRVTEPLDATVAAADAAMYRAKSEGRNCVRSAAPVEPVTVPSGPLRNSPAG